MKGGREGQASQAAASDPPSCLLAPSYRCLNETCLITGLSLALDQDEQMELRFDDEVLNAT